MKVLFVALLFGTTLLNFGESCHQLYGEKIEEIYEEYGRPSDLVDTYIKYSPDYIVKATEGYMGDNVLCSSGNWSKDVCRITRVLDNGVTEISDQIITECQSTTYRPVFGTKRLHITDFRGPKGGVASFCRYDDKQGGDKGEMAIKVYGKPNHKDVERTIDILEAKLGVSRDSWLSYGSTCEKTHNVVYGDLVNPK